MARRCCEGPDCSSLTDAEILCEDCAAINREPYINEAIAEALTDVRVCIAQDIRKEMELATSEEEIEMAKRLLRVVEGK